MQITRLHLSGFKSFVHPTELLIEPGLTGVVGPNGCGKSNLVEALRWVMGETSARGLRGGEMDDVIFAGTAARPAHDLAEVTVQLHRNGFSLAPFGDDDELELKRNIARGFGSAYRVNGREVRARDVQLLFADASSGARSAAIVSQGQIGALVEAKPTERRRLLESAAGVAGLQARRHEAELKLRATDANLVRVQDLLTALEEQHRSLLKQARQAGRYRELSASYREAEAALLIGRWQRARAELARAEQAFADGQDEIARRTAALDQARTCRDEAAAALAALRQREAALATELARQSERLSAVQGELARLDENKARLGQRREQIDQDVAHARATLADANAMRARLDAERADLAGTAERCTAELERATAAERASWEALDGAESRYREALAALAEIEARQGQLAERRDEIALRREALCAAGRETEDALARLSQTPAATAPELAQAEADLVETKAAAEAAEAAVALAQHGYLAAQRRALADRTQRTAERRQALDLAGLEQRLTAARALADAAQADLAAARERVSAAESRREEATATFRAQQAAVERLRAEADALAGLVETGVAGASMIDLVEVRDGHADALAAALGDDLVGSLDPAAAVHWRGDPPVAGEAPALPSGCTPLDSVVSGPKALARRLGQVGVVEPATARRLQDSLRQGQRLVSRDGGLWRWDGFVRLPDAAGPGAARLRQRTRLRELEDACREQDALLARRGEALAGADEELRSARAAVGQADAAGREATPALEAARDAVAQGRAQDAGLAAELTAQAEEAGRLAQELAELAAVAEPQAPEKASVEETGAARARAREAAGAARERLLLAEAEVERCRAAEQAASHAQREGELERARLHTRQGQLQEDRAGLEQAEREALASATAAEAGLAATRETLDEARRVLEEARRAHTEASAEHGRLRDRQTSAAQRHASLCGELELWAERARVSEARLEDLGRRRTDLAAEIAQLVQLPALLQRQQAEQGARIAEMERERAVLGEELTAAEAASAETQDALDRIEAERVAAREGGARLEGRLEHARAELADAEGGLASRLSQPPEELADPDAAPDDEELAALEERLARIELSRERLGPVNLRAIDEVAELALRIETLQTEQEELGAAIERLRRAIATLNREGRDRLRAAFAKVEEHFEALFVRLFGGGRAKLSLTDMDDPLEAGLELAASPPGKKLQSVSLLSGGEKALTAIALIFAVFLTRPSPLCILDEVDAPLDDANVERLGALLEELAQSTDTRFLVITHHSLTMARMDRLYGVTMAERGISELVSVDLRRAEALRATAAHRAA